MIKKEINPQKLYYGFPIFLMGYKDSSFDYNFTTLSSSYSLGNMVVVGVYKFGNAVKQVKESRCFTINVPDETLMREIEIGGTNSGKNKFDLASNLTYHISDKLDVPIIDNCMLNLECEVVQIVESDEFENYTNIIASIKGRWIKEELQEEGVLLRDNFNPVFYLGDGNQRSYRYLDHRMNDFANFSI